MTAAEHGRDSRAGVRGREREREREREKENLDGGDRMGRLAEDRSRDTKRQV